MCSHAYYSRYFKQYDIYKVNYILRKLCDQNKEKEQIEKGQLRKMTSFQMDRAFGTANAILCNQIELNS